MLYAKAAQKALYDLLSRFLYYRTDLPLLLSLDVLRFLCKQFPECSYRKYTISEIINAVIGAGFGFQRFDEHPSWTNPAIPGEFTIVTVKEEKGY